MLIPELNQDERKELYRIFQNCQTDEERTSKYQLFLIRAALNKAIKSGDHDSMFECIKGLQAIKAPLLSYDEVLKILCARDKVLPMGRKPKDNLKARHVVLEYKTLCAYPELAWVKFNKYRKAFTPDLVCEEIYKPGSVIPAWKYPHMEGERKKIKVPSRDNIKGHILEKYKIDDTTFYNYLRQDSRKNALGYYQRLCRNGFTPEEAKKQTVDMVGVRLDHLNRWIKKEEK